MLLTTEVESNVITFQICINRFPNLRINLDLENVLVHDLKFELLDQVLRGGGGGRGGKVAGSGRGEVLLGMA